MKISLYGKNKIFLKIRIVREKFRFSYSNCKIGTNLNYSEWLAAMLKLLGKTTKLLGVEFSEYKFESVTSACVSQQSYMKEVYKGFKSLINQLHLSLLQKDVFILNSKH